MSCEDYKYLIHDLVEGELDAQSAAKINSHIIACRTCKLELETALREKDFYSQVLFEIEPPKNSVQSFQARLENFAPESFVEKVPSPFSVWRETFWSFFQLKPILAAAVVLIVLGILFSATKNFTGNSGRELSAKSESLNSQSPEKAEVMPYKSTESAISEEPKEQLQPVKISAKEIRSVKPKLVVKSEKIADKQIVKVKQSDSEKLPKLATEEKKKIRELNLLQTETAVQFEKIELLLRAFRNAGVDENTRQFNVSYEKELARKLLNKNFQLRLQAAEFGNSLVAETLDNYEPYLLDIANLAKNPAVEDVLEIKQRMNNQNAILSLQAINY